LRRGREEEDEEEEERLEERRSVKDGEFLNRMGFYGIQSHIGRERTRPWASQILICGHSVFNCGPLKF